MAHFLPLGVAKVSAVDLEVMPLLLEQRLRLVLRSLQTPQFSVLQIAAPQLLHCLPRSSFRDAQELLDRLVDKGPVHVRIGHGDGEGNSIEQLLEPVDLVHHGIQGGVHPFDDWAELEADQFRVAAGLEIPFYGRRGQTLGLADQDAQDLRDALRDEHSEPDRHGHTHDQGNDDDRLASTDNPQHGLPASSVAFQALFSAVWATARTVSPLLFSSG